MGFAFGMRTKLMKISVALSLIGFLGFGGLLSSCRSVADYRVHQSQAPGFASPYRVAAVEKSWMARHKYDHERRLLIPVHNGTKWGAVQEYKEDGSIAFRDWWVRDVKVEDLEANPATDIVIAERAEPAFRPAEASLGPSSGFSAPSADPSSLPAFGTGGTIPAATTVGLPEMPELEPFVPELPPGAAGAPEIAPFELTPLDAPGGEMATPSPFAPLPGALPSAPLPGTAMPAAPLPGVAPMAPDLGAALPGVGPPVGPQPLAPAFPGALPLAPVPGGGPMAPNPLAPVPPVPGNPAAPLAPLAPGIPAAPPGGGVAPIPGNPFPPAPVDPAPGQLPGPVPLAPGGGAAPIEANPFGPVPGGPAPAPVDPAPGGGAANPLVPTPAPVGPAPLEANPFAPAPGAPAPGAGGNALLPADPFGPPKP